MIAFNASIPLYDDKLCVSGVAGRLFDVVVAVVVAPVLFVPMLLSGLVISLKILLLLLAMSF